MGHQGALLIASADAVKKHGLTPMAKIVSYAWAGVDPSIMDIAICVER